MGANNHPTTDVPASVEHKEENECATCDKLLKGSWNFCPNCGRKLYVNEYSWGVRW